MSDHISSALERAAAQQPFTPDIGEAVRRGRRRRARRQRTVVAAAVLGLGVIVAGIFVALPANHDQTAAVMPAPVTSTTAPSAAPDRVPADPALVTQVTTLPAADFVRVEPPSLINNIKTIGGSALLFDGKPGVFWEGAEYCPYCASQRWPLVVALSRFGTWSSLSTTTSSATDIYPNTATFSFYGATYSSPYLAFQSVETETNRPGESGYQPLEMPSAAQAALVQQYDSGGSIPFIDYGNNSTMIGASYDPAILKGKSASEIAAALADPTTEIGRAVLGTANTMTAAICGITGNQPAAVCNSPAVTRLR